MILERDLEMNELEINANDVYILLNESNKWITKL